MITVHSLCFNETVILGFMIDHYRQRFPSCTIVIHDNESTDDSRDVALARGCVVEIFQTGGQMDEGAQQQLKNDCWKSDRTDWVLVCDADELLDISELELRREDAAGVTLVRSIGFNMVSLQDDSNLATITHGREDANYSKDYLFKRTAIREIRYTPGAHGAAPVGLVKPSSVRYPAYHYRHIHPALSFKKQQLLSARMSDRNRRNGWSAQYAQNKSLEDIRREYAVERAASRRVR